MAPGAAWKWHAGPLNFFMSARHKKNSACLIQGFGAAQGSEGQANYILPRRLSSTAGARHKARTASEDYRPWARLSTCSVNFSRATCWHRTNRECRRSGTRTTPRKQSPRPKRGKHLETASSMFDVCTSRRNSCVVNSQKSEFFASRQFSDIRCKFNAGPNPILDRSRKICWRRPDDEQYDLVTTGVEEDR